ncbi:MAG: cyclic nucleotide-binding domain-containing protein [Rhodospirillaceae bacterium]|nr:cyclic nucleotide-binding domain-containing protein [Rhodospirillaceae bacterium]
MAENFAGKTYEVQTSDGERWSAADIHDSRTPALEQAGELLGAGQHMGVRVISDSDRAGTEIIFEKMLDGGEKVIQVVPIDEAAMCENLDDLYGFDARRTVGRLLREYLDEHSLTALELAFDAMRLMLLERDDRLFPMAVRRVAGLQARDLGIKPEERADWIYQAFEDVKTYARETGAADELAGVIKDKGLVSALSHVNTSLPANQRARALWFALARYLQGGGDWNAKLALLAALGVDDPGEAARAYLDEALAEVLDGAAAVKDLLGGQRDLGSANQSLIRLAVGRCPIPNNPISCIEAVNDVLGRLDLPVSRSVIYERVAREIGSTRALTREGQARDRDMFVTLVRELVEIAGLEGGPAVAQAVVRRARLVLGDHEDLSLADGISRVLDLLPHRAVRLGFLLDLAVSDLGAENQTMIFGLVGRIVQQMSSISSFLPAGSSPEMLHATVESLKKRLTSEGLPESWREGIAEALDSVSERSKTSAPVKAGLAYATDEETRRIIAMTPDHDAYAVGDTLFEEGEPGDQAYLVKSGEVEIVRKIGNEELVLARLGRGEIFGEMSLIDNQPRMATARISEEAELAVITRENIESRLDRVAQSDMVIRRLIDVFVTRIRGEARLHE